MFDVKTLKSFMFSWICFCYEIKDKLDIKKTLEEEARKCQWLVLWLDCDREGENIAFEVVEVCSTANSHLNIWRARFSSLIERSKLTYTSFPLFKIIYLTKVDFCWPEKSTKLLSNFNDLISYFQMMLMLGKWVLLKVSVEIHKSWIGLFD